MGRLSRSFRRVTQAVRRVAQNPIVQTLAPMAIGMPPGSLQMLQGAFGPKVAEEVAEEYAPMVAQTFPAASQTLVQAQAMRREVRAYRPQRRAAPPPEVYEEEYEDEEDFVEDEDYDEDEY